ncbi:MAG: hypothetical protein ACW967_04865 [Candidatus Hodarchaeales archaeon]
MEDKITKQNVLVTGASKGIGLAITEFLAQHNYFVFAGTKNLDDIKRLSEIDITKSIG